MQVFPNCSHPKVNKWGTKTPSNIMYALEAMRVFKHAWRGVGSFYRKGDHVQKYETANAPLEYKALKMQPPWDKWSVPKPVLISKLVIEDIETQKDAWNFFEHYKEGTEPNTFSDENPPSFQVDREYVKLSDLDPTKGNMVNLMWEGMKTKKNSGRQQWSTIGSKA